jgi:hypothetical protein
MKITELITEHNEPQIDAAKRVTAVNLITKLRNKKFPEIKWLYYVDGPHHLTVKAHDIEYELGIKDCLLHRFSINLGVDPCILICEYSSGEYDKTLGEDWLSWVYDSDEIKNLVEKIFGVTGIQVQYDFHSDRRRAVWYTATNLKPQLDKQLGPLKFLFYSTEYWDFLHPNNTDPLPD